MPCLLEPYNCKHCKRAEFLKKEIQMKKIVVRLLNILCYTVFVLTILHVLFWMNDVNQKLQFLENEIDLIEDHLEIGPVLTMEVDEYNN